MHANQLYHVALKQAELVMFVARMWLVFFPIRLEPWKSNGKTESYIKVSYNDDNSISLSIISLYKLKNMLKFSVALLADERPCWHIPAYACAEELKGLKLLALLRCALFPEKRHVSV